MGNLWRLSSWSKSTRPIIFFTFQNDQFQDIVELKSNISFISPIFSLLKNMNENMHQLASSIGAIYYGRWLQMIMLSFGMRKRGIPSTVCVSLGRAASNILHILFHYMQGPTCNNSAVPAEQETLTSLTVSVKPDDIFLGTAGVGCFWQECHFQVHPILWPISGMRPNSASLPYCVLKWKMPIVVI